MPSDKDHPPADAFADVSPYRAGLAGRCPRCGRGALFTGYLGVRKHCEECGLDYSKADAGDGPAVFVIFFVGCLAVVVAFIARFVWYYSIAGAVALSAGFALIAILGLLRPLKATLIALQYRHKAEEGRRLE